MTIDKGRTDDSAVPGGTRAGGSGSGLPGDGRVTLRQALDAARDVFMAEAPPATLQPRVKAAVGAARQPPTMRGRAAEHGRPAARFGFGAWGWPAAATLAVVLPLSLLATLALPPAARSVDGPAGDPASSSGFVPVAGAEGLRVASAAGVPAWVVTTEMPRERLGLLGLPYDPARAAENVRAELLLHGSGAVLAVRLVTR